MKKITYPLIAFAFVATAAQAQDSVVGQSDAQPQDSLPADAAAPPADTAAQAGPTAGTAVTDSEVSSYAQAAAKVQAIAKDTALADDAKQQQMATAVSEAGLAPQRFNEISQAINADPQLRERIQTAMAAHSAAHDG